MAGMELTACSCDVDYDRWDYWRIVVRKARKAHRCCECGAEITPGTKYEHCVGGFRGEKPSIYKTCTPCAAIRRDYGCGIYGALRERIMDTLGVDYVTGRTVDDDDN